jgi:hypothetical protein
MACDDAAIFSRRHQEVVGDLDLYMVIMGVDKTGRPRAGASNTTAVLVMFHVDAAPLCPL